MNQEMKVSLVADAAGFDTGLKNGLVLYDRFGRQINQISNKIEGSVQTTGRSFDNLGRVSGSAGSSVLAFSRIVQDAPFGIIGIGNNITQLVENFGALRASSKSTGAAMKAFFTSLISPGNLLVLAISAVTTVFTVMSLRARSAKQAVDSLTGSLNEARGSALAEASEIQALVNVARNDTLAREARQQAIDKLQDEYPSYLENINLENINSNKAADSINRLTDSLIKKAKAEGASSFISKKYSEILELQTKSAIANANTWDFITSSIANAGNFSNAFFDLYEKGAKRTGKETEALQAQINAANEELRKAFTGLASGGGLFDEKENKNLDNQRDKLSAVNSELSTTSEIIRQQQWAKLAESFDETARAELGVQRATVQLNNTLKEVPTTIFSPTTPGFLDILAMDLNAIGQQMLLIDNYSEVLERDLQNDLARSFHEMFETGEFTFNALAEAFSKTLKRMAAELAASAVLKLLGKFFTPGGGGGGILKGIGSIFGFANGGIVSGPTLSLTGEYPGASSNPEVIAPLNKLKEYLPQGGGDVHVTIAGKVAGPDLNLVVERVVRDYNRKN